MSDKPIMGVVVPDAKATGKPIQTLSFKDRMTIPSIPIWENNEIQFARLLCELVANWDDTSAKQTIKAVADSMDLSVDQVNELFDRANDVWEKSKRDTFLTGTHDEKGNCRQCGGGPNSGTLCTC